MVNKLHDNSTCHQYSAIRKMTYLNLIHESKVRIRPGRTGLLLMKLNDNGEL